MHPADDDVRPNLPVRDPFTGQFRRVEELRADEWEAAQELGDAAYLKAIDAKFARYIASMTARGNRGLGTYRSKRVRDDLRRERDRVPTCLNCPAEAPPGARSDWRLCSERCRTAWSRQQRQRRTAAATARLSVRGGVRHCYAGGLDKGMRTLSPLMIELADRTDEVWAVPMPEGFPDEREWRMGQAAMLFGLARDERASGHPSLVRFRRRARIYIRHMKQLERENR